MHTLQVFVCAGACAIAGTRCGDMKARVTPQLLHPRTVELDPLFVPRYDMSPRIYSTAYLRVTSPSSFFPSPRRSPSTRRDVVEVTCTQQVTRSVFLQLDNRVKFVPRLVDQITRQTRKSGSVTATITSKISDNEYNFFLLHRS